MGNAEASHCGSNPGVTLRHPVEGGVVSIVSLDAKADVADSESGLGAMELVMGKNASGDVGNEVTRAKATKDTSQNDGRGRTPNGPNPFSTSTDSLVFPVLLANTARRPSGSRMGDSSKGPGSQGI